MQSENEERQLERIDLPVTGMSCASCALRIEKGLTNTEGVSEATVNFAAEKATVLYAPGETSLSTLITR